MYRELTVLRIVFPRPGFFINDPRVEVDLDSQRIYEGSFNSGFDQTLHVASGQHQLVTRIEVGPVLRPRSYTFTLDEAPAHTITLQYSRLWGNFTRRLKLAPSLVSTTLG